MKFKFKCKVCGEELPENSNFLKHILKHPVVIYFDMIPLVEWVEGKKVTKMETKVDEEEPEAEDTTEDDEGEE